MTAGCGRRREPKVPKSLQGCGPRTDSPVCLGGWGTDGAHASCSIGKALLGTFGESQFHVWEGVCDVFRAWHFLSYVCVGQPHPHIPTSFLPSIFLFCFLPFFTEPAPLPCAILQTKSKPTVVNSFKTSIKRRAQRHISEL